MASTRKQIAISVQITRLQSLLETLNKTLGFKVKLDMLDAFPDVIEHLKTAPFLKSWIENLPLKSQFAAKSILAIGQGPIVFQDLETSKVSVEDRNLKELLDNLLDIDQFYRTIGGIIGYHVMLLKLMAQDNEPLANEVANYNEPPGLDLCKKIQEAKDAVRFGIEALGLFAEIYPVGGAGDRLSLVDPITGEPLPAAKLMFCGVTLLERLICDLQGKEYLYYKLFGKQLMTPIALMTSKEKSNHQRMNELCERLSWFGREKDSFRFFLQPLVPMVNIEGNWVLKDPLKLLLKPSGHGAIWKVAKDSGIFSWLTKENRSKFIVRQINNPIAATDNGLLALAGMGVHYGKEFGFSSCRRLLNTPEGMDVLKEVPSKSGYSYCITNIEYTEFKRCGIDDVPETSDSPYSKFPSNTNILFGDLKAIEATIEKHPLPGILLNMKNKVLCYSDGSKTEKLAGRLETTMQNIADFIVDNSPEKLQESAILNLRTFLIYNERNKTISVIKQKHEPGKPIIGTPEGCFYDMMLNYKDLLENYCKMKVPPLLEPDLFITLPLNFIVHLHPAFGGLYSLIAQKLHGGCLAKGSELILDIAEAEVVNLDLRGSLIVKAENIMGKKDPHGVIIYNSENAGKCTLINIRVENLGCPNATVKDAYEDKLERQEALHITLQGNAEFYAEDVNFLGDLKFIVPDKHRLVVYEQNGEMAWYLEEIIRATWEWEYFFNDSNDICLEKIKY